MGTQGVRALDVRVLLGSDHTICTRIAAAGTDRFPSPSRKRAA